MIALALIGVGRWGKNIQRTLEGHPEATLKYICATPDETVVLADKDDLDGVLIATPGSTHAAIALPFIKKGIATFIEKPLTTSVADALALQKAANQSGALVMVGHVHLYNPAYLLTKQLAQESGNILHLHFEGMNNGPRRDEMSALWDWAPHDVAMALDLLGTGPITIQAWGIESLRPGKNLYDTAFIKLTFPKNIIVTCHISWLFPEKRKRLTVMAERDMTVFDDTAQKKVSLYKNQEISHPEYSPEPPLKRELDAFIASIKTKQPPITHLNQGVKVVQIIAKAEESMKQDGLLFRF